MFEELEKIELAEDVFGTELPADIAFDDPHEIFNYLVVRLRGWGPNSVGADFLKQLATKRNSPVLAQGLHDSWRGEQIAAVIEDIFNVSDLSAGGDDNSVLPVRKPQKPNTGGRSAAQPVDENDSSDHR